jgi:hypothetical protein
MQSAAVWRWSRMVTTERPLTWTSWVTADGLKEAHARLCGPGYIQPFTGSRQLRDTENGVRIEFLITGGFPGDGKPKPVSFPDPTGCSVEIDGVKYLSLPKLIELKLALGMTNPGRLKDLADVQELDATLSVKLDPYVRAKYLELLGAVNDDSVMP